MDHRRNGRVIGRIVPAGTGEQDDGIGRGRVVPATVPRPIPMPTQPAVAGSEAGRLLRELRASALVTDDVRLAEAARAAAFTAVAPGFGEG